MSKSIPGMDIEDVVLRAAGGEGKAFEELVRLYGPRVSAFVRARSSKDVLQRIEVADIVQETFTKAFQHIERLSWRGERAFFGWLSGIARNLVLCASRESRRAPLQIEEDIPHQAASPSKELRRVERLERLRGALEGLPPDHRQVLVLARIDKLQVKDIAARMGRSPNAVKKLLARALLGLKRSFGDTESLSLPAGWLKEDAP